MIKSADCALCINAPTYAEFWLHGVRCKKKHKPRFYQPRNGDPDDKYAGFRRVCNDFEPNKKEEK